MELSNNPRRRIDQLFETLEEQYSAVKSDPTRITYALVARDLLRGLDSEFGCTILGLDEMDAALLLKRAEQLDEMESKARHEAKWGKSK